MTDTDLVWLAGFLEGEGSFLATFSSNVPRPQPRIAVAGIDRDVIEKAAALMGCHVNKRPHYAGRFGSKQQYQAIIYSSRAIVLMVRLWPLMGRRRQMQITVALRLWARGLRTNHRQVFAS